MIIVDRALQRRADTGNPIRVGLIGAGFMGKGIVNQIVNHTPGMRIVAIANRTLQPAINAFQSATVTDIQAVDSVSQLERNIEQNRYSVTDNSALLCECGPIDVLIESTGNVEFGAEVVLKAIEHGKHVVNMNAELDGTVGPLLKVYADRAGVVLTGCDGDQPGAQLNLYRYVAGLGLKPLVCGNIKGLQDRYRNPSTQQGYATHWGQSPTMVTSFADGTKISFEQAIVANATGMKVATTGMLGLAHNGHIDDMTSMYDLDKIRELGGIVDYVIGPKPAPGVFVFAGVCEDRIQTHYLDYGKLGPGPLYSFYTPYHLTALEVPLSVARVALFCDTVIAPVGAPMVDVITVAKEDLVQGDIIDGLGGFKTYGLCANVDLVKKQDLLPIGIAEGSTLKRDVGRDQFVTYADVNLPANRVSVALRATQDKYFAVTETASGSTSDSVLSTRV